MRGGRQTLASSISSRVLASTATAERMSVWVAKVTACWADNVDVLTATRVLPLVMGDECRDRRLRARAGEPPHYYM